MILTILGMYQYDNTIFDNIYLPDNVSHETLISNIIQNCAELELTYPDISIMKYLLEHWSLKNKYTWQTLQKTTEMEYNPIENYDRVEEWNTENDVSVDKNAESKIDNKNRGGMSKDGHDTNDTYKKAFNETGFNNVERLDMKYDNDITSYQFNDNKISNNEKNSVKNKEIKKGRTHGNIGVMTSQQMLESERDVAKFNIYDYITNQFKQEFCLCLY